MVYSENMRKKTDRALWRTYLFIVSFSLLVAGVFLFFKWQDIKQDAANQQHYSNKLIAHSISNYLYKYESFLQVIGGHLISVLSVDKQQRAQLVIDQQRQKNNELISIQLADGSGKILLGSSDFRENSVIDFGRGTGNVDGLEELKRTEGIVMGRTYFMPQLDEWLIPLSLALRNNRNEVLGVISVDLSYSQVHENWFGGKAHYQHIRRLLLRKDLYRQYVSFAEELGYGNWLIKPVPKERYEFILELLEFQLGVTEPELLKGAENLTLTVPDKDNVLNLATISYDPTFGLYTISATAYADLLRRISLPTFWLVSFLLIFNLGLYYLFKIISRRDEVAKQSLQHQVEHDPLTM